MSKIHIITHARLNRATRKVAGELKRHRLWTNRLRNLPVVLVPVGFAHGWIWVGGTGEICIPRVSLLKMRDFFMGNYTSLADVLRHEFAHAIADCHRGLFRSRGFSTAYGSAYESKISSEYDPKIHISCYAATSPSEDFAENLMHFIRHRGNLPPKHSTPAIRRKWRFINALRREIESGRACW